MLNGSARVSAKDRDPVRQTDALRRDGAKSTTPTSTQRELIIANTYGGLAVARARHGRGGHLRLISHQAQVTQQPSGVGRRTVRQIADVFGGSRSTAYGHLDKAGIDKRSATVRDAGTA